MTPEISRRCPFCGVSVRDADALFCAECGKPLSGQKSDASSQTADVEEPAEPAAPPAESAPQIAEEKPADAAAAELPHESHETSAQPRDQRTDAVRPNSQPDSSAAHPHRIAGRTRETLHRASAVASAAARGVIEEPAKRVEKIRNVSTHVIEEASYDPSLRFVLVALGLFVVFVILLVLSKVMG